MNVLLVTPAAIVLVPVVLRAVLRAVGALTGPSRMLDTIPFMAHYFLPRVGWLAAPAAWMAWRSLREMDRTAARMAVSVFLAVHLATVAYTVWRWVA